MDYIGIPFEDNGRTVEGADCYGIVYLYYKNEMGIDLPLLSNRYKNADEGNVIERIVNEIKPKWKKVTVPKKGDVIVFHIKQKDTHVGVFLGNGRFLHGFRGIDSCAPRIDSFEWKNRISGIYRYE